MQNIHYIEQYGFKVKGRYILKHSTSTRGFKTVGILNEKSFYFFSDNVYPFKGGTNFFKENSTLVSADELLKYKTYVKEEVAKEKQLNDFDVDYEKYEFATKVDSVFLNFLNTKIQERLNTSINNYYDVRGVRNGYLEGSAIFPIFDFNNNFVTAQIIKYKADGKRNKVGASTNWFHSYNPIKEDTELDLDTKYSVRIKSFFGENMLNGSDNIVCIVEAPKTAVILKEFYPQFDWIATFGEKQIKSKNLDVLKNKRVVLFPDAQTTLWKEIASKKGYYVCNVLDENNAEAGSDLADYIFGNCSIAKSIHNYLNGFNYKFDLSFDDLELDFRQVGTSGEYFPILPFIINTDKGTKHLTLQADNSDSLIPIHKGTHFEIYDEEYQVLNANLDFHRVKVEEGNFRFFNEVEFVEALEKCFRILAYLNEDIEEEYTNEEHLIKAYKVGLKKLLNNSNFRFNIEYVLKVLVPKWIATERTFDDYYKSRKWRFTGKNTLSKDAFGRYLYDDIFRSKIKFVLADLKEVLKENRFIHHLTDIGIDADFRKSGYGEILDLVSRWNENVIGAKTSKSYFNQLEISKKLSEIVGGTKNYYIHISNIYRCNKKVYQLNSLNKWCKILQVKNKETVKHFFEFKSDNDERTLIEKRVKELLNNVNNITLTRGVNDKGETRINGFEFKEYVNPYDKIREHQQDWNVFTPLEDLNGTDAGTLMEIEHLNLVKEMKRKYEIATVPVPKEKEEVETNTHYELNVGLNNDLKQIEVERVKEKEVNKIVEVVKPIKQIKDDTESRIKRNRKELAFTEQEIKRVTERIERYKKQNLETEQNIREINERRRKLLN